MDCLITSGVFFFFLLGFLCGSTAGVMLFLFVYPFILFFLEQVGVLNFNPDVLLPVSFVFFAGSLFAFLREERQFRRDTARLLEEIKRLEEEKNKQA